MGEVAPLSRSQSVQELHPLVTPLVQEVNENPRSQVVGAAGLVGVPRNLRDEEGPVRLEVPSHRVQQRGLPHARSALEHQDLAPPLGHAP